MSQYDLGITCDMHVHLRDGKMMELVTPTVRQGGVSVCYVMPNLVPPITTIEQAVEYKKQLEALSPTTTFLMSFYLHKDLTPELVAKAADEKVIRGIKCYPAGVTTNSSAGVDPNDFTPFYPVFEVMQDKGLILNLHGEKPPSDDDDIHVLNAEVKFLPALAKLHKDFPKLKIILEHCTTKEAIETIREINKGKNAHEITVGATITAHHLWLIIDNWAGNPINFCKPVAKLPQDRSALVEAATSGEPWFFFGSDSAPHPIETKARHEGCCAGVYTQLHAIGYVAEVFDKQGKLDNLKSFVSTNPLAFYEITEDQVKSKDTVLLVKNANEVPKVLGNSGEINVVPFKAGQSLNWSVEWK